MDQNPITTTPVMPAPVVPDSTSSLSNSATNPPTDTSADQPADSPVVMPDPASISSAPEITQNDTQPVDTDTPLQVAKKIADSQNVLIALSGDPSVDEMSAAIGLSLYLDKLGKRATAIYSGSTPNALEFLNPENTFENTADTLQDFVIALNKDKADHLRYKLDGDYVKIFITPYKTRIDQDDLEFSYGDFNVDLVLALDVANGIDLDAALREHGRIMHDAVIVNITTGNPGRFGEIEWSDKTSSSVSEMIARLLYNLGGKVPIDKDEATAFLTGIVAATDRFSNAKTTSETMQIASKLMESGANQQLISKNITPDVDNELYSLLGGSSTKRDADPTSLDIEHTEDDASTPKDSDTKTEVDTTISQSSILLDDLKAAEASLATAGAETVPDNTHQPVKLGSDLDGAATLDNTSPLDATSLSSSPLTADSTATSEASTVETGGLVGQPEKVIQPPESINLETSDEGSRKYGKMLEDAISGLGGNNEPTAPIVSENPAAMMAPEAPVNPEINGVPEMNYMPLPGEEVLPPPPAPPINMSTPEPIAPSPAEAPASPEPISEPVPTPSAPSMPESLPTVENQPAPQPVSMPPVGTQPAMQDQIYNAPAADPGAFKIPGM